MSDQQQNPLEQAILLPDVGPLAQVLHNASIDLSLPHDARARLDWDATGYSFTWLECHYGEDESRPDVAGLSLSELISRVFDVLFETMHLKV